MIVYVLGRLCQEPARKKSLTSRMVFSMKTNIRGIRSFEEGHASFGGALYKR